MKREKNEEVCSLPGLVFGFSTGRFERNKSLTNEEIETFWKIKRQSEEEHLQAVAEGQAQEFSAHNNINVRYLAIWFI